MFCRSRAFEAKIGVSVNIKLESLMSYAILRGETTRDDMGEMNIRSDD